MFYRRPQDVGKAVAWRQEDLLSLSLNVEGFLEQIYRVAPTTNAYGGQYRPADMVAAKVVDAGILKAYLSDSFQRAYPDLLAQPDKPRVSA